MSSSDLVLTERAGPLWTVTLNDPDRRNAVSLDMRRRLVDALSHAAVADTCRAVVLTGAGPSFCAGGDLSSMTPDANEARSRLHAIADVIRGVVECPKPVVAAVDGHAFGAGLSLACACDVVIASAGASFCSSFARVGLTADAGLHWSLPARVGAGRARMLIMLGNVIDAATAAEYGLVDTVCDGPALDAAKVLAEQLARRAPGSLAATKSILAAGSGLEDVLAREAAAQRSLLASDDFAEGRAAFFEKRSPVFEGR